MTPRVLDPATVREKLQLLEVLLDALAEVGEVSEDRLKADVVVRLAVERVLTQAEARQRLSAAQAEPSCPVGRRVVFQNAADA